MNELVAATMPKIQDFDPLSESLDLPGADRSIFQEATKRVVQNILKSYTNYYDAFSEMLQNALDAIDAKHMNAPVGWAPSIWITIDIPNRVLRVVDNGVGMDLEQFLYCFRPNVSFKSRRESRGHKGVGATFLAYGYSLISLQTKRGGQTYAARMRNTHIVVHFTDGNPDMGRKVFQPELKLLAEELSKRVVDIFKRYIALMREDAGNPIQSASREMQQWLFAQENWRAQHPLEFNNDVGKLAFLSEPQAEQDVVALFHELLGMQVLRGYGVYATSQNFRYDSLCFTEYPDSTYAFDQSTNPLGVALPHIGVGPSGAMILEYKYNMDGLIADFAREEKFPTDVKLCVCWDLGEAYKEQYSIESLLIGSNGSDRIFFGATHKIYRERVPHFEVVCLKDLMAFLVNPEAEEARQRVHYN